MKVLHVSTADTCSLVMGSLFLCPGCNWLTSNELSSRFGLSVANFIGEEVDWFDTVLLEEETLHRHCELEEA